MAMVFVVEPAPAKTAATTSASCPAIMLVLEAVCILQKE
jgi:hypothetical protein